MYEKKSLERSDTGELFSKNVAYDKIIDSFFVRDVDECIGKPLFSE